MVVDMDIMHCIASRPWQIYSTPKAYGRRWCHWTLIKVLWLAGYS